MGAAKIALSEEEVGRIRALIEETDKYIGKDATAPEALGKLSWVDTPLP